MKSIVESIMESSGKHITEDELYEYLRMREVDFDDPKKNVTACTEEVYLCDGVQIIINHWERKRPGSGTHTSSAFDREYMYVEIADKKYGWCKDLFDLLMKAGLEEARRGKNSQWGTWKFAIRTMEDLEKFVDCFEEAF